MRNNRDERDNNKDAFDRAFVGNPVFMIVLVLIIIIVSLVINYFK